MILLVMRHGQAEPYEGQRTDAARALTSTGDHQAVLAAQMIARCAIPDMTYVSPYLRTQQTASTVVECLRSTLSGDDTKRQIQVKTKEWLTPDTEIAIVCRALALAEAQTLLLVTHMPLVSVLTEYLTGVNLAFDTGQVVRIDLDYFHREQGELKWLV